jgi:arylsulfatase A-like enzyme
LHEHQLKVPLILKSPTLPYSGKKIQELVGIIDIALTILDILRIPIPNEFQGTSLFGQTGS